MREASFDPDRELAYLRMADGAVRALALATGETSHVCGSGVVPVLALASRVPRFVQRVAGGGLQVLDDAGAVVAHVEPGEARARSAWIAPNGDWLVLSDGAGPATLRGVGGQASARALEGTDGTRTAHFDGQGTRVLLATGGGRCVVVRLADGEPIAVFQVDGLLTATWSADGNFVAVGADAGLVSIHDAATGARLSTFRGGIDGVTRLAWSWDGAYLATADTQGCGGVWHVGLESRDPAAVGALVSERVPFRLEGGRLLPVQMAR